MDGQYQPQPGIMPCFPQVKCLSERGFDLPPYLSLGFHESAKDKKKWEKRARSL